MNEAPDAFALLQALQFAIENPESPTPELDNFLAAYFRNPRKTTETSPMKSTEFLKLALAPKLFSSELPTPTSQQNRVIEEIAEYAELMEKIDNNTKLTDCLAILKERGKQRDQEHGERLMATIIDRYNSQNTPQLTVRAGYEIMKCIKIVRFEHSKLLSDRYDSLIDLMNYTALQGESDDHGSGY